MATRAPRSWTASATFFSLKPAAAGPIRCATSMTGSSTSAVTTWHPPVLKTVRQPTGGSLPGTRTSARRWRGCPLRARCRNPSLLSPGSRPSRRRRRRPSATRSGASSRSRPRGRCRWRACRSASGCRGARTATTPRASTRRGSGSSGTSTGVPQAPTRAFPSARTARTSWTPTPATRTAMRGPSRSASSASSTASIRGSSWRWAASSAPARWSGAASRRRHALPGAAS
mmetsp:Transcript_77079/g.213004  ORF Transcript_77079/g.213004 Transcript_77079/m.213004 type:complete len:229 (-) Transcript_77079:276-962(-)